jgi:hypothetical protein
MDAASMSLLDVGDVMWVGLLVCLAIGKQILKDERVPKTAFNEWMQYEPN